MLWATQPDSFFLVDHPKHVFGTPGTCRSNTQNMSFEHLASFTPPPRFGTLWQIGCRREKIHQRRQQVAGVRTTCSWCVGNMLYQNN